MTRGDVETQMLSPDMIVHWMQLTAGSGVLQPWFLRDGWDEVERRMQPALDAGVTQFCWWCWDGWTVQSPETTPREECWGKIPWLIYRDGRSRQNPTIRTIEDEFRLRATEHRRRGVTIHPYWGCPRLDATILNWLEAKVRFIPDGDPSLPVDAEPRLRTVFSAIEDQGRVHRGFPLIVDAMSAADANWMVLLQILRERINDLIILEGQAIPPAEFGHLLMHRDWRPDVTPLSTIAAAPNPWKGCLIRSDADLNGADRVTRVRELVDAGVHVVIDSGSVL